MTTTTLTLIGAGWLACSVVAYLLMRADWRREHLTWSRGDRFTFILISLMGLPAVVAALSKAIFRALDDDRPAKW